MVTTEPGRVGAGWLALREPADAAARAVRLVEEMRRWLPTHGTAVVHDLGCGTGSMARWLAPLLPGRQHWVMHDRNADLLAHAAEDAPDQAADGAPVTVETMRHDVTRLAPADLAGAHLVTASALLDILTRGEVERLAAGCAKAGCPVLVTLSVTGRAGLTPAGWFDQHVADAFDAHQRRAVGGRRLLGPDAVAVAAAAFDRSGLQVLVRPSPWRLGPDQAALAAEWLTGWVAAASERRPELRSAAGPYTRHRLADATAGRLSVTVHHLDLLALPPEFRRL